MADEKDLVSPGGLSVVASVSSPEVEDLRKRIKEADKNNFSVSGKGFLSRVYQCGHKGARTFTVDVCGVEKRKIKQERLCPNCYIDWLKNRVPLCVACSLPIFPGDIIALYSLQSKNLDIERAVFINESVAGCGRIGCCPTGALYAGCLTEKGFFPMFSDGSTTADVVMGSGRSIYATFTDRNDEDEKPSLPQDPKSQLLP